MNSARILGVYRHRLATDGKGVTTLVGFHGCPLRCRYCINPFSFDEKARTEQMAPSELYERLKCDDLYFVASGGGVTFGGGEPLLNMDFLEEFRSLSGNRWRLCAETSLAVPSENVRRAAKIFDEFFVDIKDADPHIYQAYTGGDSKLVLDNIRELLKIAESGKLVVRLPLIKDFNTEECRKKSEALLRDMGVTRFDKFVYKIK